MSAPNSHAGDDIWKLFKTKKIRIASQINVLFPFLHGLRDEEIISEEVFKKCKEKVDANPKVMHEEIYNVLEGINSVPALRKLFCKENLDVYPHLKSIYEDLENALQKAENSSASEQRSIKAHQTKDSSSETSAKKWLLRKRENRSSEQRSKKAQQTKDSSLEISAERKCAGRIKRNRTKRLQGPAVTRRRSSGLLKGKRVQNPNFQSNKLQVYCGKDTEGVLYKDKLVAGISQKCIMGPDGKWFTLDEFEVQGGRGTWKCWRRSIRCNGDTLESLIRNGELSCPPRKPSKKTNKENPSRPCRTSAKFQLSERKCAGRIKRNRTKRLQGPAVTRRRSSGLLKGKRVQNPNFQSNTLQVYCGKDTEGVLYKDKLAAGISRKSIMGPDGKWFTPEEFEVQGGRGTWKCWKKSIRCSRGTLESLIRNGELPNPPRKPRKKKKKENLSIPGHTSAKFQLSEFPVQFGTVTGVLHKHRFAAGGPDQKCIRLEERWCTPKEFVEMGEIFESWDKDIRSNGVPLQDLLEAGHLEIHPNDCSCETCKTYREDVLPENDNCAVCVKGGLLTCCDSCSRSFHGSCHIPPIPEGNSKKWICTFCELKSDLECSANSPFSQEDLVLTYKMLPIQTLKCMFLLLKICCEPESATFAQDPTTIPSKEKENYDDFIEKPMWLRQVEQNLNQKRYEKVGHFVEDMRLIFKNCQGKEAAEAGRKLHDEFEKSFQEVFFIKQPVSSIYMSSDVQTNF
ncbi:nuclear body protein SP140-like protein isoform X2 [Hemicordylus capensis]|uniref:nuclear body protein SP140-like protein isoform X2 n=1 Tax=Hemicordylus capensis TaxID=884348 RepID=UPI0023048814|nr:nuclear body protein SP140-like protein isoform X2 [Hemicordylus capensis]